MNSSGPGYGDWLSLVPLWTAGLLAVQGIILILLELLLPLLPILVFILLFLVLPILIQPLVIVLVVPPAAFTSGISTAFCATG